MHGSIRLQNIIKRRKKSIKNAKYIIGLLVIICIGTVFLFMNKSSGFIPSEDDGCLYVTYQLPDASSTTQSVEVMES